MSDTKTGKRKGGFSSMTPERQRELASKGGKASHAAGTGHTWTSEDARAAGRKGAAIRNANAAARKATKPTE